MADLTLDLYTTTWCPDCRVAKRVLRELGVDYREIDIEQNPQAAELVIRENQGKRRVPTLAIAGRFYGNPRPAELRSLIATALDAANPARAESTVPGPTPGGATPAPSAFRVGPERGRRDNKEIVMRTFIVHSQETAPEASRFALAGAKSKYGFVPNLIGMLADSPAAVGGYLGLGEEFEKSSFTPAERQVVLLAVSYENACDYCMAAHSVVAGMSKVPAEAIEALRSGGPLPDARLESLAQFTRAVVRERGHVSERELAAFLAAGFTQAQVLEVVLGVAMKTLSNYANHIARLPLDPAFAPARWEPVHDTPASRIA